jgi:hypothetical protein
MLPTPTQAATPEAGVAQGQALAHRLRDRRLMVALELRDPKLTRGRWLELGAELRGLELLAAILGDPRAQRRVTARAALEGLAERKAAVDA